jgi:hypothetical protein
MKYRHREGGMRTKRISISGRAFLKKMYEDAKGEIVPLAEFTSEDVLQQKRIIAEAQEELKQLRKKVAMRYMPIGRLSKPAPGRVAVHNHVTPHPIVGRNGFRAWTQLPDEALEVCPCEWAGAKLPFETHYRVKRKV